VEPTVTTSIPQKSIITMPRSPAEPAAAIRTTSFHNQLSKKAATAVGVPFKVRYDQVAPVPREPDDSGSDVDPTGFDPEDDLDADEDDDETLQESQADGDDNPHTKQYQRGPLPRELVDEVRAISDAFERTLAETAQKYNRPLHTIRRLANLEGTICPTRSPNPFNGYARKRKLDGLPQRKFHIV
jgi:hypothetical protein